MARHMWDTRWRSLFPPVQLAFAYGSAVFRQSGREMGKMIDMVFVVPDPVEWHKENMSQNPSHYSFLRVFGPNTIARMQQLPAAVYYNTLVTIDSQLLKYGVISTADFLTDLTQWKWLYISGRLHKPVQFLTSCQDHISNALQQNLRSAILCALLLLNKPEVERFNLYTTIAGMSYLGDFRMVVGEDRNKVKNIVTPALSYFESMYEPELNCYLNPHPSSPSLLIPKDELSLKTCESILPLEVQKYTQQGYSVEKAIQKIVSSSSKRQSIKGILTAGPWKTIVYSSSKLQKMFRSMDRK